MDQQALIEDRFWNKVYIDTTGYGCWEWMATRSKGYGLFTARPHKLTGNVLAHRIAYTLVKGEIPEGLDLDHLCRSLQDELPARARVRRGRRQSPTGRTAGSAPPAVRRTPRLGRHDTGHVRKGWSGDPLHP